MNPLLQALLLSAGYNTALVTIGAALLGASAGAIGTFVLLRKRSLVSDAISHATLPGLGLAFIVMALLTGDGRFLPGLLLGASLSAALGLVVVEWLTRRTRLAEDAAIGAVLSVFFGMGIVVLTIIQTLDTGGQAGISSFLIGASAGMLRSEAETIAVASLLVALAIFVLRRPFTLMSFDAEYAAVRGINLRLTDLALMGLLLAVTVIGLKVAGLVLIVALTIIPPVAARFWTERPGHMVIIAAVLGALASYFGAAISATDTGLPTGALIVLVAAGLFMVSLLVSPVRGVLAAAFKQQSFKRRVHERQGLLALARNEVIADPATAQVLRRAGHVDAQGQATPSGLTAARAVLRDEQLWQRYRDAHPEDDMARNQFGLQRIETVLPADVVAALSQGRAI